MRTNVFLAAGAVGLICTATANSAGVTCDQSTTIENIFVPDMIHAQVAYLEHLTGPAWRVDQNVRQYKVAGCVVTVIEKHEVIQSLGLELNERCTFDLNPFLQSHLPSANRLTFGAFDQEEDGRFYADCLSMCGNSTDPIVYEHFLGPHAMDFIEVNLKVALVDDQAIAASNVWEKALESSKGLGFIYSGKFNCTAAFDGLVHRAFAKVKVTAITIGYGLDTPSCNA